MKRIKLRETVRNRLNAARDKRRKVKTDLELTEAVSFLRNTISDGRIPSTEQILTELAEREGLLAEGFAGMLSRVRQNDPDGALDAFTAIAGKKEGADIGRLLLEWDRLEAAELSETLLSYQRHLSEMRYTARQKQDELTSDVLYIPVVANVMLVFINFIFVGYFLEQQEMFRMIF